MISMQTSNQKASLNPVLKPFWQTKARNKVLCGGRASSKSWDAAGFAIFLANKYRLRFLCVRQIQNKIQESVYSLLKIQIERFGLKIDLEFWIIKSSIKSLVQNLCFMACGGILMRSNLLNPLTFFGLRKATH